jgi:hypothetical protein
MRYNASSTKYVRTLSPTLGLINGNTTIYGIRLTSNRSFSGQIYNGTSDRAGITIYDIFPPVDNQWDVALVIMLIVIQWIFVILAYRFYDEHIMVKYGFIAISLFFNGWLMAIAHRIIAINGAITPNFTRLFESSQNIALVVNWIFTSYIFIYLIYYMIHNVMQSAGKMKGTRK